MGYQRVINKDWTRLEGNNFWYVSAGDEGVWGLKDKKAYKLNSDGNTWSRIRSYSNIKQIASGDNVWARAYINHMHRYCGHEAWEDTRGGCIHFVSCSNKGHLWVLDADDDHAFRLLSKPPWPEEFLYRKIDKKNPKSFCQISVGESGVWAVNKSSDVFYRTGTYGDPDDTDGSGWEHVKPTKLKWVSSGKDLVVGVDNSNNVFYREGITRKEPTGTRWVHVPPTHMKRVDINGDELYGVNPEGIAYRTVILKAKL